LTPGEARRRSVLLLLVRIGLSRVKPRYMFLHRVQEVVHLGQQPERII
jgi:hypothetical protein